MRGQKSLTVFRSLRLLLVSFVIVLSVEGAAFAQSGAPPASRSYPQPDSVPNASADDLTRRVERARALAAAHQLEAAAGELESVRAVTNDAVLRDGTSVMLMGIYLEAGNYARSQALVEEAFQTRLSQRDDSIRRYFVLAGQAVNGLRIHVVRYRSFGVDIGSAGLPGEAANDLDRLRVLLERMAAQARETIAERTPPYEGLALLEDVLGIRLTLARNAEDRERWQTEYAEVREKLGSAQVQFAAISGMPPTTAKARGNGGGNIQSDTTAKVKMSANPDENSVTSPSASDKALDKPTIASGLLNDRASKRVIPVYPPLAKGAKIAGVVRVFVIIDETGKVTVTKTDGPLLLRQAAEDAARLWHFPAPVSEGTPARLSGYIEFNFEG